MSDPVSDNRLERMLKRVLKPLVAFLLHRGITYTALLDALKSLYIEVAIESTQLSDKRLTDSRISLLTGVHRKEVKRLREQLEQHDELPLGELNASLGAAVMAKWLSDPIYLDDNQRPLCLPKSGDDPSFESLVYSISKDKHFRSLLDDWLEQGIVTQRGGMISLQQLGFVPSEDEVEQLYFAGKNLGAHIETVSYNLKGKHLPMFERAVFYSNLPATDVTRIEEEAKRRNLETLTALNEMAADAKRRVAEHPEHFANEQDLSSFHVGAYFLRKPPLEKTDHQETST